VVRRFEPISGPTGYRELFDLAVVKGEKGDRGAVGEKGQQGDVGERGVGVFDTIKSGTALFGSLIQVSAGRTYAVGSLPAILPQMIEASDILIVRNDVLTEACPSPYSPFTCFSFVQRIADASVCTGSFETPSAPAGKLCIYPSRVMFASPTISLDAVVTSSSVFSPSFSLTNDSGTVEGASFRGVWAYTAP
jgi:hypothetical protein